MAKPCRGLRFVCKEQDMSKWYVIQVRSGQEEAVAATICQLVSEDVLEECFAPKWQTQHKVHGRWENVERRLIPGYLVAVARDPKRLESELKSVPDLTKLLHNGEGFIPLDEAERDWLDRYAQGAKRIVPISKAFKEGDDIVITEGPLKDREFRIARIDRRRSTAYIEVEFLGRKKEIPVGLMIVSKQELL